MLPPRWACLVLGGSGRGQPRRWLQRARDCDQYSPRFATARLYVNGKLLDTESLPGQLSATRDGGLLVGMRRGAATALFKSWRVSKLSSGR